MNEKQKNILFWFGLLGALLLVLKILKAVGLIDSKEDEQAAALDTVKEFSPSEAQKITDELKAKGYTTTAQIQGKFAPNLFNLGTLAKEIFEADKPFNDDEQAVYSALQRLKNRYELSLLTLTFAKNHKAALLTYLKDFLDNDELAEVFKIVSKKPRY